MLGLGVENRQTPIVQGILATGEWFLQKKAGEKFCRKDHVDHNGGELENNATCVREQRSARRGRGKWHLPRAMCPPVEAAESVLASEAEAPPTDWITRAITSCIGLVSALVKSSLNVHTQLQNTMVSGWVSENAHEDV